MPTKNLETVKKEINKLIALGKEAKAIESLLKYFEEIGDQGRLDEMVRISSKLSTNEDTFNSGEKTMEQYAVALEKIKKSIQGIFNEKYKEEDQDAQPIAKDGWSKRIVQIYSMIVLLFTIIGIVYSVITEGLEPLIRAIAAAGFVVCVSMIAFGLLYFVKKYILV